VLPKHVGQIENAPQTLETASVQVIDVINKKQCDFDQNCTYPRVRPEENSIDAVNENACKQQIKSVVSKSRTPKLHVPRRGPNTFNLIEIELSNSLSRLSHTALYQTPSYCVPLIRRNSGDQRMVYLYSPPSHQSHSLHEQGLIIPSSLFPTQNKPKKHVRFIDL
jgi:hypothetical protein